MSIDKIMEDWSDYDSKKILTNSDVNAFSCDQPWEIDVLIRKVRIVFPHVNSPIIDLVINNCCFEFVENYSRKKLFQLFSK